MPGPVQAAAMAEMQMADTFWKPCLTAVAVMCDHRVDIRVSGVLLGEGGTVTVALRAIPFEESFGQGVDRRLVGQQLVVALMKAEPTIPVASASVLSERGLAAEEKGIRCG